MWLCKSSSRRRRHVCTAVSRVQNFLTVTRSRRLGPGVFFRQLLQHVKLSRFSGARTEIAADDQTRNADVPIIYAHGVYMFP